MAGRAQLARWIATCPASDGAVVTVVPLAEAAALPVHGEHGLAEAEVSE